MTGIRLYFRYISISIQSQLQYRVSFIMMTIGNFVFSFIDFIGIWVLFSSFQSLGEWSFLEVAMFYGIVNTAFAMSETFSRGFDSFHRQVRSGDFDRALLRPRSTVLQVLGHEFPMLRIGRFTQGIIILVWAAWQLQVSWTIGKIILLISAIMGGCLIFSSLYVLQATLSFWSVQSLAIANAVTYGGIETAQYPLSIYSQWFRRIFTFIIPLAYVNYFPALGILDKVDPLGYPEWLQWMSPIIGLVFFLITLQVWKIGIRHYRSTGS